MQFVTAFQASALQTIIANKLANCCSTAATAAQSALLKLLDECDPIAAGGAGTSSWKSGLPPNAKLKDALAAGGDVISPFALGGDVQGT